MALRLNNSYFKVSNGVFRSVESVISSGGVVSYTVRELLTTTGAGTWSKPVNVTSVTVECWGAGGGGGGSTVNNFGGGGGGGGAYAKKTIIYSAPSENISYTVGVGGTTGTGNAGNGGNSFWQTNVVLAEGGKGGLGGSNIDGGLLGLGGDAANSIGDIVYSGGRGINGAGVFGFQILYSAGGGAAGSTGTGGDANGNTDVLVDTGGIGTSEFGGNGADGNNGTADVAGTAGSNYGGAGSGGYRLSANRSGGAGAQGLIRVSYSVPPPLQTYTGSSAAFSIRKLTDSASFCMRIRRSSDNATQDIGFQADGLIDTGSLLTFVGSNTGYVTTWYNQVDYENNAIVPPATSIQEPYIVSSGSLMTLNGKPSVFYNALAGIFAIKTKLTDASGLWSTYGVGQVVDTSTRLMVRTVAFSGANVGQNIRRNAANMEAIAFNTAGTAFTDLGSVNPGTTQFIAYSERTATAIQIYVEGATNTSTATTGTPAVENTPSGSIFLGFFGGTGPPSFPWSGNIQEVIHYPQSPVTFNYRTALTTELNSYYGAF